MTRPYEQAEYRRIADEITEKIKSGELDLAADLRLARKIHRKCVRDGFPLEILLANYLNHRRDAHTRHIEPVRSRCDLVVDAQLPADQLASRIWQAIDDKPARDS